ncbi:2-oxoglutarate dehydrogenase E1 component [Candidatus Tremblaya phenacola]|uniref:oxoglutarate dehydrogenase (succinyl-transferring) n=1 Tax=Candidatus Tremblayella phenacoccinincola TaxID=1010676 RepID=A0A2G0V701_9PROT|nr:2-oxoglutarate dehydrogenase E1 component [Candidatus Tremblaya phenacola]PHN16248.1 2-oxoglutarate dehydrogenase E1 component [Candidatus Tremblaya phenacola]
MTDSSIDSIKYIGLLYRKYADNPQLIAGSWSIYFSDVSKLYIASRPLELFRGFNNTLSFLEPLNNKSLFPNVLALSLLRCSYCHSIYPEVSHLKPIKRVWIWRGLERTVLNNLSLNLDVKKSILYMLTKAYVLENHLANTYVGQKRFSIEGSETVVVLLNTLISLASKSKITDIVVGMAHRGRLNILINIYHEATASLYVHSLQHKESYIQSFDVKYHFGCVVRLDHKSSLKLTMVYNPSHLETVNPIAEGISKAKLDIINTPKKKNGYVLPIQIHGDAAITGQGTVVEALNYSGIKQYRTYGTIHIVINNQIGFTTQPKETRSATFCTDQFKTIETPVFHVDGNNPDSVVLITKLALMFRMKFLNSVVLDIIAFRRLGHNEQDTPDITQPLMYSSIKTHNPISLDYLRHISNEEPSATAIYLKARDHYLASLDEQPPTQPLIRKTHIFKSFRVNNSCISLTEELKWLLDKLVRIPQLFRVHPLLKRTTLNRRLVIETSTSLDWCSSEHLAYALVLNKGIPIRLSGQDVTRGTFMHRNAVLYNQSIQGIPAYAPLQNISSLQGRIHVINTPLSEGSILGFEYGYALVKTYAMVIWEAQFGDFINCAQVLVDQLIASGGSKWGQASNIVLYLPHGQEGQGSEHSSARLERLLQLSSSNNITVVHPTSSAQLFHIILEQASRKVKRPLTILTPKSLLRLKASWSTISDFTSNRFRKAIVEEQFNVRAEHLRRLLVCSGKIYYQLASYQHRFNINRVSIIRLEQLYPFPNHCIPTQYRTACEVLNVQDEPKNQGIWQHIEPYVRYVVKNRVVYCGAQSSDSTALGFDVEFRIQKHFVTSNAYNVRLKRNNYGCYRD